MEARPAEVAIRQRAVSSQFEDYHGNVSLDEVNTNYTWMISIAK
jgi:hypothetical protein